MNAEAVRAAALGGHLDLFKWLRQEQRVMSCDFVSDLVKGVDLPTLQQLTLPGIGTVTEFGNMFNQQPDMSWITQMVITAAAGSPTPDWQAKVAWLEDQGFPPNAEAACAAAAALPDAVARLEWLRQRGYVPRLEAATAAARAGNDAAMLYLLTGVGVRLKDRAVNAVAEGGRLETLQALHAGGWPINAAAALGSAARFGHLRVVAWLVETFGMPVSELRGGLLWRAAKSGNVALLAWLRDHGCRWDAKALPAVVMSGCEDAIRWMIEEARASLGDARQLQTLCRSAERNGDLSTLECLRQLAGRRGAGGP